MKRLLWMVLIVVPACQSASMLESITADELMAHIEYLADDAREGRMTGTPGCRDAADYIAEQFEAAGVQPGGQYKTYFQHFTATAGQTIRPTTSLRIDDVAWSLEDDFAVAAGMGAARGEGELVFVGYGISAPDAQHDDYEGRDVADKVVVALVGAPGRARGEGPFLDTEPAGAKAVPRAKIEAAFSRKAAGIILVRTEEELGAKAHQLPVYRSERSEGLTFPAVFATPQRGMDLLTQSGTPWKEVLAAADAGTAQDIVLGGRAELLIETTPIRRHTANVIGTLPGAGAPADEVIVVGAHYDHLGYGDESSLGGKGQIHNGADDNASGVAAMLEIAAACATRRSADCRRLVFIAFSAEEIGLLGSAHYVKHPLFPVEATVAMLNLDMVGRSPDGSCAIGPVECSPFFANWPQELAQRLGLEVQPNTEPDAMIRGASDHESFLQAEVPSLAFFSGLHEDYHRPTDDVEHINLAGAEQITRLACAMVLELDGRDQRPAFEPLPKLDRRSLQQRSKDRPWFGSIPAMGDTGNGVLFSGVGEGSPAEKAGLRGGDRLIRFNGQPVNTLDDFVVLLRSHGVGDTIDAVVLRDGEEVEARVTLAVRQ